MTDMEKFKALRPTFEDVELDYNKMPIVKKATIDYDLLDKIVVTNFKNLKTIRKNEVTIIDMFNYDSALESLWNNPLKYVPKFQTLFGVATPDFSIYPGMNKYEVEHNVYKNRWLGATWQSYGINVFVTMSWGGPETYDVCFSGVEKGSVVIISTLGVGKNKQVFLDGFNEMRKRIEPSLIIVVGKIIEGMEGNFLLFKLNDTFTQNVKYEQLSLFDKTHFISIGVGGLNNG